MRFLTPAHQGTAAVAPLIAGRRGVVHYQQGQSVSTNRTSAQRPRHDHRHLDPVQNCVANRAQHQAVETTSAVTADHDKLCGF
jgi:hypothetical protein